MLQPPVLVLKVEYSHVGLYNIFTVPNNDYCWIGSNGLGAEIGSIKQIPYLIMVNTYLKMLEKANVIISNQDVTFKYQVSGQVDGLESCFIKQPEL